MDYQSFIRLTNELSNNLRETDSDLEELANNHDFSEDYRMHKFCEVNRLTSNLKNIIHKHNKNLSEHSKFYKELDRIYQDVNTVQLKAYKIFNNLIKENSRSL